MLELSLCTTGDNVPGLSKKDPAYWDTGAALPRVLIMTVRVLD